MINSFSHKGLQKFFETGNKKGIPTVLADRIRVRLDVIDAATSLEDINLPGYDLHQHKGNRKGIWVINVNGPWRITFKFVDGDAEDVNLEQYH
jgi:toxin HigB-1